MQCQKPASTWQSPSEYCNPALQWANGSSWCRFSLTMKKSSRKAQQLVLIWTLSSRFHPIRLKLLIILCINRMEDGLWWSLWTGVSSFLPALSWKNSAALYLLTQGWNRVLVSVISWPGQLLSLYPCLRPKILARMLFLGILSLKVVILDITAYLIIDCDYWWKQTNA